jgi:hypothetical protein
VILVDNWNEDPYSYSYNIIIYYVMYVILCWGRKRKKKRERRGKGKKEGGGADWAGWGFQLVEENWGEPIEVPSKGNA